MKSVTFWVTLEFSRRHRNLKPKRFAFCIEYKPIDRTCLFRYQWLELFDLLEEIGIKSSVAFLKCFSIFTLCFYIVFVHYLWSFDVNRRRKVLNRHVWSLRSTEQSSPRHDLKSIERYVGQSTITFVFEVG